MHVSVLVPLHAPPQPVKTDPALGAANSVADVATAILVVHVRPQLMPAGRDVTVPLPVLVTVKAEANVALTATAPLTVVVQVPVPEQPPPDHPVNTVPAEGAAVSVTDEPAAYSAAQVLFVQLMPPGTEVTVALPPTLTETLLVQEVVGTRAFAVVLLPTRPSPLYPQHSTAPAAVNAQSRSRATTPVPSPVAATGVVEIVLLLLPSSPEKLDPRHVTPPVPLSAQV
jgi:hypothetical protein